MDKSIIKKQIMNEEINDFTNSEFPRSIHISIQTSPFPPEFRFSIW